VSRFSEIREECCTANKALLSTGLVDLTFGNVSVCDREENVFAIKPSGVPYGRLKPGDMVIVDFEGQVVEGNLRPSSDTPTHRKLFLGFPAIRAVVHTHSRHAVSFAQAAREIPLFGTTHADYFRGAVPVTRALTPEEISSGYEWETGQVIVERFASLNPAEIPAVLVRNHGPFTWGPSGDKAVETAFALEIIAQMAMQTLALNPSSQEPDTALIDKHFLRKHGSSAYYGQVA
jgi:L-ribulose-5-phosphate 4-epimerase